MLYHVARIWLCARRWRGNVTSLVTTRLIYHLDGRVLFCTGHFLVRVSQFILASYLTLVTLYNVTDNFHWTSAIKLCGYTISTCWSVARRWTRLSRLCIFVRLSYYIMAVPVLRLVTSCSWALVKLLAQFVHVSILIIMILWSLLLTATGATTEVVCLFFSRVCIFDLSQISELHDH
jgi:hypothetical protein